MQPFDRGGPVRPENIRKLEQPTPELPPPIAGAPSPLWPQHLVDLFFRPARFFSGNLALGKTPYLYLVTLFYGMASWIDRIDERMVRAEISGSRAGWRQIAPLITESWLNFWVLVLIGGAVGGLFLYWIGGWWYIVRLKWSDAADPDTRLARLLYIYSSFVYAAPAVLLVVIQTFLYPHYQAAYDADEWYSVSLLVFPFWSIWTSYRGVRSLFPVNLAKARVWFLILPSLIFGLFLIGIVIAVVLVSLAAPADVENPKEFSQGSLTFSYPGNWDLDPESGETFALVEAPQDAVVRIDLYETDASLEEEVGFTFENYAQDFLSACEEAQSFQTLGAFDGYGREWRCQAEGDPYNLSVFAASIGGRTLEVTELYDATQAEKVKPGYELVRSTLQVN